jgi:hypothetical protein
VSDLRAFHRRLGFVCGLYLLASLFHANWGLPNGNRTWAADSVAPMTPLAVAYRTFAENGFNSGYFYFKYPVGHQLLLAAATTPVMGVAYARGDLTKIESDYPFGLRSPDSYLTAMAIIARVLSALFATATLAVVGRLTARAYGARAGLFAAVAAAGCYPLLFYAHTSNVETAFMFWAMLALYYAIAGVEEGKPRALWLMGVAAAMAVSTKEQIAGFLVLLPFVLIARRFVLARSESGLRRIVPPGAVAGGLIALLTWAGVNAAFFNPSGFVNRIRFLTHTLPPEVRELYAAYEFPVDFSTSWTASDEAVHLGKVLDAVVTSVGWPAALVAVAGAAYVAISVRRAESIYLLASALGYYFVSLRALKQVELRYVLPLALLSAIPAGVLLARISDGKKARRSLALGIAGVGIAYAADVLPLLAADARYDAERWMAPYLEKGHSVEVYQSWTYLPRWEQVPTVSKPPTEATSVAGVRERDPDFIVISSKGKEGITMYPNPDWRDGRGMMLVREESARMLRQLESGDLGYELVRRFERTPLIPRELITSLGPAIDVYRRAERNDAPGVVTTGAD